LEGNAKQIGKSNLQSAAATVEHQLADGTNSVTQEQMNTLKKELDLALKEYILLIDN